MGIKNGDQENTYYEEFILMVSGGKVKKIARASALDGDWNIAEYRVDMIPAGWKIVKVYQPEGNEYWLGTDDVLAVQIGYMEQRLTALERLAVKLFVAHYWDIPF